MNVRLIQADVRSLDAVAAELAQARKLHKPMHSAHEAYAVILEELDEFWDEVKKKRKDRRGDDMAKELSQVAAMAVAAMSDLGLWQYLPKGGQA